MRMTRITTAALAAALCATLFATSGQAAGPVLIAIGTISGFYEDFATETAPPLENGVAGNRLGGIGSALAYAGGDDFLALPDRGPNAVMFNACTDDTVTYINRFHTLHMTLAPSDPKMVPALPFTLTPMVVATTPLSTHAPLVYGPGCGAVGDGAPALNELDHTNYFTGRSDGFESGLPSTNPLNARLDPEGIRVSADREHVFISDEYGPYVYEFDRRTGRRTRIFSLPSTFAVQNLSAIGNDEIANNHVGRVTNKGMEGLAITPDGRTLVGAMQSPLLQDGGDIKGGVTRIVTIDTRTGQTRQYAYQLDGSVKTTISEILAVNDHEFLVDERDSKGLADDSQAVFKRLYKIDLAGASDVSHISGQANLAPHAVPKQLFLDIVAVLTANGMSPFDIPAKLEGLAFGQDVTIKGVIKHTLYVANDNDYLPVVPNAHGTTTSNPNRWFVFAFDSGDLPGYQPQHFKDKDHDDRDDR
ncbi:MAG TPA: esterase-like activity of phytase family protein [Vicinamibacterales bacterium]|nr:esterase-like activity of phytase family protein [Vicinamibacterales bacterium]